MRWFVGLALLMFSVPPVFAQQTSGDLEPRVRAEFEQHLQKITARIERMEQELAKMKRVLQERSDQREELIRRRVAELVRESKPAGGSDTASAKLLVAEGWQAWQKQDWRTALEKFQAAKDKDPSDANMLNGLGWTQFNIGEHESALETFDAALAIDPTQAGAMNGVGQVLLATGRTGEAIERLTAATESLIEEFGEARVVQQGMTASWVGLVRSLARDGQTEAAKRWVERYQKHAPDDPTAKMMLRELGG